MPRQPSPEATSAAERQLRALQDVERIAERWYDCYQAHSLSALHVAWRDVDPRVRLTLCTTIRELLERDVIRVGRRPTVCQPLVGQMEIWDADDDSFIKGEPVTDRHATYQEDA